MSDIGELFNNTFDNIIAVCWRLLELPLFVLLAALMGVFVALWFWIKKQYEKRGRSPEAGGAARRS